MNLNQKINIVLILALVVLILLNIDSCNRAQDTERRLTSVTEKFTVKVGKDSAIIATQAQNVLTLKEALALGTIEREKYMKDIVSQIKAEIGFSVKTIPVPYIDSVDRLVYIDSNTLDTSIYIKTPLRVARHSKFFNFAGTVKSKDFTIDSFSMFTDLRVTVFEQKDSNWFRRNILGKSTPVVEIKSSNPDTKFKSMSNVQIKTNKPFYKKVWFGGIIGAAAAFWISSKI